jgi:hypothetical protein
MERLNLVTMREVTATVGRPAHRVIHLCETRLVTPAEDAAGRGTVRRFRRGDIFLIALALDLQDAGLQIPHIRPLFAALEGLLRRDDVRALGGSSAPFDITRAIHRLGSKRRPVLARLAPLEPVILVTPKLAVKRESVAGAVLTRTAGDLFDEPVAVVANLTRIARGL